MNGAVHWMILVFRGKSTPLGKYIPSGCISSTFFFGGNMNNKAAKTIKKFKTLTRLMSDKEGIKINFSGNQCFTDFKSITLPIGDFTDKNYLELIEGAIDHEVGHLKWTDKNWTAKSHAQGQFFNGLRNAIEDVRMERAVSAVWPGAHFNLSKLVAQAIRRQWFMLPTENCPPAKQVLALVLFYGRFTYCEQHQLKEFSTTALTILESSLGEDVVASIVELLDTIPTLKSNQCSFELTEKIVSLLKDQQDNSDDDSDGDSDDNSDGDSDDDSDGDSDDNSDGDSDGDSDDNSDGDSDDNSDGDRKSKDSKKGSSSKFIKDALNAGSEDLIQDLHEAVRELLEEEATEYQNSADIDRADFCFFNVERHDANGPINTGLAAQLSGRVSRELQRVVQGLNVTTTAYSKRGGQIDGTKLAGVPAGNHSVFQTTNRSKSPNMAFSILVDNSGSMGDKAMAIANVSSLALAMGLDKLKGVTSEVLYYNSSSQMHCAKAFSEKARATAGFFGVKSYGGTMTGHALITAIKRLAVRPEERKTIVILSDGDTADICELRYALELANSLSIKVVCLGILAYSLDGFEDQEFININELNALQPALRRVIKSKIIE